MEIVIESKLNIRCRGSRVALKRTFEFSFANYDTIDTTMLILYYETNIVYRNNLGLNADNFFFFCIFFHSHLHAILSAIFFIKFIISSNNVIYAITQVTQGTGKHLILNTIRCLKCSKICKNIKNAMKRMKNDQIDFADLDFHLSICLYNRKQVFLILINFLRGSLIILITW